MKKKFVLTLALVLMVAATLVAAPLEIGGNFKAGYAVTLKSGANGIAGVNKTSEISLGGLSVSGDYWKVTIADETPIVPGDNMMAGTATVYLSKALAAQGMDMGDLSLEMTIGNKTTLGGLSVYSNSRDKLGDYKLVMKSGEATSYSSSMTVGYGSLVTVMVGADIGAMDTSNKAFVIGAKTTPVEGVSAAISYTNLSNDATKVYNSADGAVDGSVKVDIAALAGLDFGLAFSAYDAYFIESKENNLYLELKGSYADFSAWTEYRIRDKRNDMMLKVSYAGIENLGLSAQLELDDITDKVSAKEIAIGAGMTYNFGGVTYGFEGKYKVEDKSFTMSPTVKIVF